MALSDEVSWLLWPQGFRFGWLVSVRDSHLGVLELNLAQALVFCLATLRIRRNQRLSVNQHLMSRTSVSHHHHHHHHPGVFVCTWSCLILKISVCPWNLKAVHVKKFMNQAKNYKSFYSSFSCNSFSNAGSERQEWSIHRWEGGLTTISFSSKFFYFSSPWVKRSEMHLNTPLFAVACLWTGAFKTTWLLLTVVSKAHFPHGQRRNKTDKLASSFMCFNFEFNSLTSCYWWILLLTCLWVLSNLMSLFFGLNLKSAVSFMSSTKAILQRLVKSCQFAETLFKHLYKSFPFWCLGNQKRHSFFRVLLSFLYLLLSDFSFLGSYFIQTYWLMNWISHHTYFLVSKPFLIFILPFQLVTVNFIHNWINLSVDWLSKSHYTAWVMHTNLFMDPTNSFPCCCYLCGINARFLSGSDELVGYSFPSPLRSRTA